jgi:hypothetical protein
MARSEHDLLKIVAYNFLKEHNYEIIYEEFRIEEANSVVDIYAPKENIVVECGGSKRKKLLKLKNYVNKIYILPYGTTIPYEWNESIIFCETCGTILNHDLYKNINDINKVSIKRLASVDKQKFSIDYIIRMKNSGKSNRFIAIKLKTSVYNISLICKNHNIISKKYKKDPYVMNFDI